MGERYVTLAEVKELLEQARDERELSMEQRYALTHAESFSKLSKEDSQELVGKLMNIEFIHEKLAYKIADLVPTTADEIKALFAKERAVVGKSDIEEILSLVKEYL